ncbi:hypothetical protein AGLY_015126, partial [Aphis glycines]
MEAKSEACHRKVMERFKIKFPVVKSLIIIIDFETALRNVFLDVYPEAQIVSCWFHFVQSLQKNIKKIGYSGYIKQNREAKMCLRMCTVLAFLPAHQIEQGFQEVKIMPKVMKYYCQDFSLTFQGKLLCLHNGKPCLFITFTCNIRWTEITNLLSADQKPSDRHDLIARNSKKKGLPHSHILIWLENKVHPDRIDNIISAELPDPEKDPHLLDIIKKKNDTWTMWTVEYIFNKNGYPLYRRRSITNGGFQTDINVKVNDKYKKVYIDNQWIVPYCPLISKIMNAHINVELCSSVVAVKYILKYIHKGSDQAMFSIENKNNNVIEEYQSGRYINSNELIWQIFGFKIHDRYPNVQHLHVHLKNGQRVYFSNDNVEKKVEKPSETILTTFFSICKTDDFAKTLLYNDIPKYFTWDNSQKKFNRRKQGIRYSPEIFQSDTLGRMYTIHPINDITYKSYREACQQLGLLKDDKHWDDALAEANETKKSSSIRSLFSIILTSCNPSDPQSLWEKYKK